MKPFKRMTFNKDQTMKILTCLGHAKYGDSSLSDEERDMLHKYTKELLVNIADRYKIDWSKEFVDIKDLKLKPIK